MLVYSRRIVYYRNSNLSGLLACRRRESKLGHRKCNCINVCDQIFSTRLKNVRDWECSTHGQTSSLKWRDVMILMRVLGREDVVWIQLAVGGECVDV
jgi:hypothetical protein